MNSRADGVVFYDKASVLWAVLDGVLYVPVRAFCEHLGVNTSVQLEKLQFDPEFAVHLRDILTPSPNGMRKLKYLAWEAVGGWLFTINSKKTKREVAEKLAPFRREVMRAATAIINGQVIAFDPTTLRRERPTLEGTVKAVEEVRNYVHALESHIGHFETTYLQGGSVNAAVLGDGASEGVITIDLQVDAPGRYRVRVRLGAAEVVDIQRAPDDE